MMTNTDQIQEFKCTHCGKWVSFSSGIGTKNRNHCPFCLWSRHVDDKYSGDRGADCRGEMKPIGLTFKHEGVDKYGKEKQGELMLIHRCEKCARISVNRIAGDDNPDEIYKVFKSSKNNAELRGELKAEEVSLLRAEEEGEIKRQLFGKL